VVSALVIDIVRRALRALFLYGAAPARFATAIPAASTINPSRMQAIIACRPLPCRAIGSAVL